MERYLTLSEATSKYPNVNLQHLIESGKLKTAMLTDSEIIIPEGEIMGELPREQRPEYARFKELIGHKISIGAGSRKYGIPDRTVSRWVQAGYIKRIEQIGQRIYIDEADLAYCADIYKSNPGQGKWLFNKDGTPYQKK